jgi:ATP-dependent DNA helicase RecG
MGTQQSGMPDLRVADLLRDREILAAARYTATVVLESDPGLTLPVHAGLAEELRRVRSSRRDWSRIS